MKKHLSITFLALCLFMASCNSSSEQQNEAAEKTSQETPGNTDETSFPNLQFERLDGTTFNLSEMKGKRVFLSFWATWCGPCIKEMPSIESVKKELGDEVEFVLVSDEEKDLIQNFANKKGYDLTFVKAGFSLDELDITGLPTNIILDKEGKQEAFLVGARDWHSEEGMSIIKGKGNSAQ